jgi:TraB family protein
MNASFRSLCLLFCLAVPVHAQADAQPSVPAPAVGKSASQQAMQDEAAIASDAIVDMDAVVVSGAQPGPGMWKVSRGEHVLYVLGTLSPLPKRIDWVSRDVEDVVARSQAVILPPSLAVVSDTGFFRSLLLVPSLLRARNNPGGKRLEDVVSPALYARWQPLKARYLGRDRGVEKRRPILAAQELYEAAMRKSGLDQEDRVGRVIEKAAKRARVPLLPAEVKLVVKDPKAALKELNAMSLHDADCFAGTLTRIEADLGTMRMRANAWAIGDIDALRALPFRNQYIDCVNAITETGLARRLGFNDVVQRVGDTWVQVAEDALARNQTTFATLPVSQLLQPDGYVERLRAKGYMIEAP